MDDSTVDKFTNVSKDTHIFRQSTLISPSFLSSNVKTFSNIITCKNMLSLYVLFTFTKMVKFRAIKAALKKEKKRSNMLAKFLEKINI